MIAQSQPGTGKTAAFVLPMLSRVDATKNYPQVLFRFTSCMFLAPAQLVKKPPRFVELCAKVLNRKIRCIKALCTYQCKSRGGGGGSAGKGRGFDA